MTNQEKICLLEKRLYLLTVNGRDNQGVRRKIQREIQKLQGMDNIENRPSFAGSIRRMAALFYISL